MALSPTPWNFRKRLKALHILTALSPIPCIGPMEPSEKLQDPASTQSPPSSPADPGGSGASMGAGPTGGPGGSGVPPTYVAAGLCGVFFRCDVQKHERKSRSLSQGFWPLWLHPQPKQPKPYTDHSKPQHANILNPKPLIPKPLRPEGSIRKFRRQHWLVVILLPRATSVLLFLCTVGLGFGGLGFRVHAGLRVVCALDKEALHGVGSVSQGSLLNVALQ